MTTYTWTFPEFEVAKSEDGLTDVVKVIHWRYSGTDGQYTADAYGTAALGEPNPSDFIPYDQITKEWAIAAVSSQVDVEAMNANFEGQIAKMKNPPVVAMQPPF